MGYFSGIGDVKTTNSNPYFVPGQFVLKVEKTAVGESTRAGKGAFFVSEFHILESNTQERPPGTTVADIQFFSKGEISLANIKRVVGAILACDPNEVTEEVMEKVTEGEGTLLAGRYVYCNAYNIVTQKGNDFTRLDFRPLTEEEGARLAAGQPVLAQSPQAPQAQQPAQTTVGAGPLANLGK